MNNLIASVLIGGILINPFNFLHSGQQATYPVAKMQEEVSTSAKEITVLMYHDFIDGDSKKPTVLPIKKFEEQMKYLYDNGYKTATLEELEKFIKGEILLPKKTVVLTFDDGYLSNYLYAYPILKKYDFKAAIFVVTSTICDSPEEYTPDKSTHLSWKEMKEGGYRFSYQSHTHNLHQLNMDKKSYLMTHSYDDIVQDLRISKDKLNADFFAYPYGFYDEDIIITLKRIGFKMAFTVTNGRASRKTDPFKIPRYGIDPSATMEQFKKYIGE